MAKLQGMPMGACGGCFYCKYCFGGCFHIFGCQAPGGRVDGRFQGLSVLFTTRGIATSTHASPLPPTPLCLFWFTPGDISTEVLEAMGELVTSLLRGMKIEPNDVAEVRGQCEPRVSKPLPLSIDVSICQVGPA